MEPIPRQITVPRFASELLAGAGAQGLLPRMPVLPEAIRPLLQVRCKEQEAVQVGMVHQLAVLVALAGLLQMDK